jgi:hypothetical protein
VQAVVATVVQMAAMAMVLLDYVTYPRQQNAATSSCTRGGDDHLLAATLVECTICLGQFEDGDWCSVMLAAATSSTGGALQSG